MSAKRLISDSLFFAYTIAIVAYAAFGTHLEEDFFTHNFANFLIATAATLVISAALAAALRKQSTISAALFEQPKSKYWRYHALALFLLTTYVSLRVTEASLYDLFDRDGLAGAWRLWRGITTPNFDLLPKAIIQTLETVLIAFLATVIAIPIAFVLAFFCAKNIMTHPSAKIIYAVLRIGMNISRSVEPLIWALIFTVWVGVGPFAGMLALMIHSVASLAKYYSEILEGINDGPVDGVRSTGANTIQTIWYAIVPQILLPYIGMTIYRWDTNVRMATVIGLVGGGGIGTLLIQYQGQAMWPEVGCIILVIAVIVWAMDFASAHIREALK